MLFFKKKKDESFQKALLALKEFRDIGEKFNFMGIEMIVQSHVRLLPEMKPVPLITAAYRNKNGELKYANFTRAELPSLIAENS